MIRFEHVTKGYPDGFEALQDLSFEIGQGEMVFVTGHSGAGKTTLLRLIGLIETCTRGEVQVGGHNLARIERNQLPYFRRKVGMVFQDHRLLGDRTVFDNVALPLVVVGAGHKEVGRRVRAALDKVDLLKKEKLFPVALSAGEQQRVGIARAIVTRPPVLLADEPTGNLDPDLSVEIMRLFREFNQVGATTVVASHDWGLISRMGRRILVLRGGRLMGDGIAGGDVG